MADIVRNAEKDMNPDNMEKASESVKEHHTDRKGFPLDTPAQNKQELQFIRGNGEIIMVKLLEAINTNLSVIQQLLVEIRNKK